jgi:hypothetical protein
MGDPVHLVHGMGTGLEAPSWPAIAHDEAQAVLAMFPEAGRLIRWTGIPRARFPAALAQTDRGRCSSSATIAVCAVSRGWRANMPLSRICARAVPVVDVLATRDGASALPGRLGLGSASQGARARSLSRSPVVDAVPVARPCPCGRGALARLHLAAQGFVAPARPALPLVTSLSILTAADPPPRGGLCRGAPGWRTIWPDATGAMNLPPCSMDLRSIGWRRIWHANRAVDAQRLAPVEPFVDGGGDVASVLDFGLSDRTCALHDLATALERCAVRWLDLTPDREMWPNRMPRGRCWLGIMRCGLELEDRALLARLLPLVHVEFAMSERTISTACCAQGRRRSALGRLSFRPCALVPDGTGPRLLDVVARG